MLWLADGWNLFITANRSTVRDVSQRTLPWYRILLFLHAQNDLNQSKREANYVCYTKQPHHPLTRTWVGPNSRSWDFGDGKNLSLLPGIKPRLSQSFSSITKVTELSQILVLYKKDVPVHAIKIYTAAQVNLHSLNLSTRWRHKVSFAPQQLYALETSPLYLLNKRLGWMEYNLFFIIFQFVSYLSTAQ